MCCTPLRKSEASAGSLPGSACRDSDRGDLRGHDVNLRLCEGLCENDSEHPESRVSLGMIDPDDDALESLPRYRISDIAFTTREKAEAAIRKMRLNEEDVNA